MLPHRPPFLFVDRIVELTPTRVVGVRTFRPEEDFFKGHFPGQPIVPGVLLIEGLAQTMGYYALHHRKAPRVFLVGIDRARFRGVVEPGVEVTYTVDVGEERFGTLEGRGKISAGKKRLCDADVRGYAGEPGGILG
ncbi:MAG: beta-hydroxyacyl-ACP dehydratase [Archangiaceae bacterium]|nr:beta-hydroxyacyl-ACP dehydratase [Archangiaceae bacterium]